MSNAKILLLNAGSSSLKCVLMEAGSRKVIVQQSADWAGAVTRYKFVGPDGREHSDEVAWSGAAEGVRRVLHDLTHVEPVALPGYDALEAVGHRVVHGGPFTSSVRITPEVRSRISSLANLAPLHNPPALEALAAAEAELPGVPQVAVFDTAFHATLPPEAWTYPIPQKWTNDWGIRRYGFHGLSHAYCSRHAAEMFGRPADDLRLVICHLGAGCSDSAIRGGQCIATTMGFTPLDGLMMGTRSGSIDPSIVLYVQQHHGLTVKQVETALNRESGLLGVSGISGDMRQVLDAARAGHQRAQLALAVYTCRARQAIGALAVTMGGVDGVVFAAGVGEHSAEVREAICAGLECLGLELDTAANAACQPDADVARPASRGRILVITTREDLIMLEEVLQTLGTTPLQRTQEATAKQQGRQR